MKNSKHASISRKLTWMNLFVSGSALILACAAFIGYDTVTTRNAIVRNLSSEAQIIGSNSASALLFNDPQAAENTLQALKDAPNVLSAVIYGPDGKPFASYIRDRKLEMPAAPALPAGQLEVSRSEGREIQLVRSIVFQGKATGTVYIRSDLKGLTDRLVRFVGIAGIVLLGSLLAAMAVSALFRKSVAQPIVDLAEIASTVSHDKNYKIRAKPIESDGELATLISAFNEMLAQIESNEKELLKAQDKLEQRVLERTAELQAAKDEVEAFSKTVVRAKEELERASKFKDQFLSTMSHELRTPLNAVLGFSDLLIEERYGALNDRQRRYLNHIRTGGKHLLKLINDILDLSKIEAGRLQLAIENVRLDVCFAEAIDTLNPLASQKSQTLERQPAPGLSVRADATRLKQVLINLLGNAIKFTPENGTVKLAAKLEGGSVRIEVRDSGPGIPPDEQKRIFEAFYRLRNSEKAEGTGLGLAITQRLVELHGGTLSIESEMGVGSCFYFMLPLAPTVQERVSSTAPKSIGGKPPVVVVIEDDSTAASLLEIQLSSAGFDVRVCNDPKNSVEMVAALQPAAVTVDIVMKPVNGWEILASLKGDPRTGHVPVIVVTIIDQPSTGALLGADEYIVKPVEKHALLEAVDRCMRRVGVEKQPSVLVVEDNIATREFIAESLSQHGLSVETVADGEEARIRMEKELPKLVILDLILPKVSGFQLLAEWRSAPRTADLPVFVLTSKDLSVDEKAYLETHTSVLLQKQDRWQETLFRHLWRALPQVSGTQGEPAVPAEKS
jgi:signal transduction histidine kinase/DNA-binding response OmpR family regulator